MIGKSLRRTLMLIGVAAALALAAAVAATTPADASSTSAIPATLLSAPVTHPSAPAYAAGPASASGSESVTGTIPGTDTACTSYWNWYVSWPPTGGYSEVEWTSNPCGFRIEDRSRCESVIEGGNAHYNYSGIVKSTYLWDKAGCGTSEMITWAQERFESGSGWSSWNRYWSRP
jgi:hypothetical protein